MYDRVKSVIDNEMSSHMAGLSPNERALIATPTYTYKELSQATNGFSANNKLGQGKFGSVYLGILKNTKVAIKKLVCTYFNS